jgi:hypothetical protein
MPEIFKKRRLDLTGPTLKPLEFDVRIEVNFYLSYLNH